MKRIYLTIAILTTFAGHQIVSAQCFGTKGPNILGAKGTFSAPYITVNASASACIVSGSATFNPAGNIGNALGGCTNAGAYIPCSDYVYTAVSGGLDPESRYSIIKVIGDANGFNCIKGQWKGSDHTGDGGYFMAVNGAPSISVSPIFYQVKTIPVCIGATYEFSAWVINLLPSNHPSATPGSQPNISFKVNGTVIANSGPIAYNSIPTWVKVGGTFTATTNTVDLQVVNATAVASGNDLGLDDISFNICQSQISVDAPSTSNCAGVSVNANFTVTDPLQTNSWYKWQLSTDGGSSYTDLTTGAQATFVNNAYSLTYNIGIVTQLMNGNKYRLAVSTSQQGLSEPACGFFNDYTLVVADCGPLPVKLSAFNGRYTDGIAYLDWQTSQELDSYGFKLFKSYDGVDFSEVATIRSAGNSNTVKSYTYQDRNINAGNNVYYRIKQIDINGKATFSNIIRLSTGIKTGMDVYPNPFNTHFTVSFNTPAASVATLKLRNNTGQVVFSQSIKVTRGNNAVVLNNLPALGNGVYYLSVQNEQFSYNGKLQKQ